MILDTDMRLVLRSLTSNVLCKFEGILPVFLDTVKCAMPFAFEIVDVEFAMFSVAAQSWMFVIASSLAHMCTVQALSRHHLLDDDTFLTSSDCATSM